LFSKYGHGKVRIVTDGPGLSIQLTFSLQPIASSARLKSLLSRPLIIVARASFG